MPHARRSSGLAIVLALVLGLSATACEAPKYDGPISAPGSSSTVQITPIPTTAPATSEPLTTGVITFTPANIDCAYPVAITVTIALPGSVTEKDLANLYFDDTQVTVPAADAANTPDPNIKIT